MSFELVFDLTLMLAFRLHAGSLLGRLRGVSEHAAAPKVFIEVIPSRSETKLKMAQETADALGIARPVQSRGSSVDSTFLDRIHTALTNDVSTAPDSYRATERVLHDLGLTYDPFWDTSESKGATGGGTVTNRAFSRIRSAVTGVPRCFIINVNDADAGARWETDHEFRYAFDTDVSARDGFKDAGPGSRVVYYATKKNSTNPQHFVAHAEVEYIGPGWTGPWEAIISNYTEFRRPVPVEEVDTGEWNRIISITEITYDTYRALVAAGDADPLEDAGSGQRDPGGEVVAKRVLEEIPLPEQAPDLNIPGALPTGQVEQAEPTPPTYRETETGDGIVTSDLPPNPKNTERSKQAEKRAVELVKQALGAQGWRLARDCQKDGVGYDLKYVKDERELHVEVKGIISTTLAFNLTPKESWRVETDPDFVVVAVTNVLSPTAYDLQLLTREQLAGAQRVITGYRLKF